MSQITLEYLLQKGFIVEDETKSVVHLRDKFYNLWYFLPENAFKPFTSLHLKSASSISMRTNEDFDTLYHLIYKYTNLQK